MNLLSVAEAATILNLSRQRVWFLIDQGRIKAQKIGRGWTIARSDLNRFNDSRNHVDAE